MWSLRVPRCRRGEKKCQKPRGVPSMSLRRPSSRIALKRAITSGFAEADGPVGVPGHGR